MLEKILYITGDQVEGERFNPPEILVNYFKKGEVTCFRLFSIRHAKDDLSIEKIIGYNMSHLMPLLDLKYNKIIATSMGAFYLMECLEYKKTEAEIILNVPVCKMNLRPDNEFNITPENKKYRTPVNKIIEVENDEFAVKGKIKEGITAKEYISAGNIEHIDTESLLNFMTENKLV